MALAPVFVWLVWPHPALVGAQIVITLWLFWRHRSNIANIFSGREGRIADDR
jgi:glycerol-3-phosphate acyltransferase PlsY